MSSITIQIPPGISRKAVVTILLASTSNMGACLTATGRRASAEGITLTEDELRRAILFMRGFANDQLGELFSIPSNGVTAAIGIAKDVS